MKTVNVVAAIIKKNNKVFIAQRGHGEFKGKWEFPGGKIEVGETPEEAVVREIREELKSEVKVERLFDEINETRGDKIINVKFFICSLISGNLELTEHLASKWVDPSEINDKDFLEADKPILDNLKNVYITVEIDIETKEKFEKICEDAGLTMSSVILLFIEKTVSEGRFPFDLTK
ncbi:MAG: NUDIX domain-containing protein [Lachnospiraceae bacterium]|nr:NUDIX domain-containing protein [Lachnospiraceae bacterium]